MFMLTHALKLTLMPQIFAIKNYLTDNPCAKAQAADKFEFSLNKYIREPSQDHCIKIGGMALRSSIPDQRSQGMTNVGLVILYRLTLHPLAKYPGPLLGRITNWGTAIQASSGARHLSSRKEHEIYGPIVRTAPNTLSVNTIAGLTAIYASRNANVQKSDWYRIFHAASRGASSTHSEVDPQSHAFRRRVLEHGFSGSALRSAEKYVHQNVDLWCKYLAQDASESDSWTPARNMSDWCSYLSYDVMGDWTFGKRFNCIESDEHRYVPNLLMERMKLLHTLSYLPLAHLVRRLLGTPVMALLAGKLAHAGVKYTQYSSSLMEARIAAEKEMSASGKEPRKDFAHYLLNAKDPQTGKGFSLAQLRAESSLLIAAGTDTVASTMSATLFYLLNNPSTLKKLTVDIRSAFSSPDQIDGNSMSGIPYLRACVDEALRLSPPAPGHLPREVLASGLVIENDHIPPGTVVGASSYVIHHNPEYYPDPFKFRPERWIVDEHSAGINSPDAVSTARAAFCAFSLGRRGCIGKNIAYIELGVALAKLIYKFDMRLPENRSEKQATGGGVPDHEIPERRRSDEYQLVDHFLVGRDGPWVEFRARE
ncbi:hypothetical protein AJ78_00944 [Emergomyces pasteurianus Ep9510]|uniref:Cytochrome P450 monooxygenase n=1 Tax=Emergomyces pasteurianus Ep9510 TaxID=1447872 RepID=A0A1J9QSA1_9EURO|nr:hypothetical protein AJ78_00944 [Emergomyces pasteurianus Ep9510]